MVLKVVHRCARRSPPSQRCLANNTGRRTKTRHRSGRIPATECRSRRTCSSRISRHPRYGTADPGLQRDGGCSRIRSAGRCGVTTVDNGWCGLLEEEDNGSRQQGVAAMALVVRPDRILWGSGGEGGGIGCRRLWACLGQGQLGCVWLGFSFAAAARVLQIRSRCYLFMGCQIFAKRAAVGAAFLTKKPIKWLCQK